MPTEKLAMSGTRYFRTRHFTNTVGSSFKFWSIKMNPDATYTVRFGRIGTGGQSRKKEFGSQWKAQKAAGRIIQQKLDKGYEENVEELVGELGTVGIAKPLMVLPKVVSVSRKKPSPVKRKTAKKVVTPGRVISFEKEQ